MKSVILVLFSIILIVLFTFALFLFIRHWKTQNSDNQRIFLTGTAPDALPNGVLDGLTPDIRTSWIGKRYDVSLQSGVNLFTDGTTTTEGYPFKTYVTKSMVDPTKDILRLDYSSSENPWWVRHAFDEVVQVRTNEYLGKVCIRFGRIVVALGYFTLTKAQ